MKTYRYLIRDELGLHARPAGMLVKLLNGGRYQSSVQLKKGARSVPANRIFSVMSLAAKQGDVIEFQVEGADEALLAEELAQFCSQNL